MMYRFLTDRECIINIKEPINVKTCIGKDFFCGKNPDEKEKLVFLLSSKDYLKTMKLSSFNQYPVVYSGNDLLREGIVPDFTLSDVDGSFYEKLESFWYNRKQIKRELHMIIKNDLGYIEQVIDEVFDFIQTFYAREDALYLKLVLDESLNNAYYHGNKQNPERHIRFLMRYYGYKIEFTIEDEGKGFNVSDSLDKDIDVFSPRGRGIMLINSLMDEVAFRYRGNIINMVKYI
ncbi:MAG: hypothetical protein C0601_04960 [Candidatus Muiribacterium halophilum]|uniref:Histidine kinase/HSP90-like ATPase domain-containing protein n=1 Tax=Muiribacterium halophilum TaxID=2053465 RepID=A0A2N5ZIB1_MUIH1|nr:MAG: hypothetical protein C0601_04960 [Candidatus Muirbacterium halophilum]